MQGPLGLRSCGSCPTPKIIYMQMHYTNAYKNNKLGYNSPDISKPSSLPLVQVIKSLSLNLLQRVNEELPV